MKCEKAFEHLKGSTIDAPMLANADPSKSYKLHVDASRDWIGGMLYQESEGKLRPVTYVSRSLTPLRRIIQCTSWSSLLLSGL